MSFVISSNPRYGKPITMNIPVKLGVKVSNLLKNMIIMDAEDMDYAIQVDCRASVLYYAITYLLKADEMNKMLETTQCMPAEKDTASTSTSSTGSAEDADKKEYPAYMTNLDYTLFNCHYVKKTDMSTGKPREIMEPDEGYTNRETLRKAAIQQWRRDILNDCTYDDLIRIIHLGIFMDSIPLKRWAANAADSIGRNCVKEDLAYLWEVDPKFNMEYLNGLINRTLLGEA